MAVKKICLGGNKIILSDIIFPSLHRTVSFKQTTEIATKSIAQVTKHEPKLLSL